MKKIGKFIFLGFIVFLLNMTNSFARELTLDELGDLIISHNPSADAFYVIGKYAFTMKYVGEYNLNTEDFMLAARSIDVLESDGKTKGTPAYTKMSAYQISSNTDDYGNVVNWYVGDNLIGTNKITDDTIFEIDYIDYEKVKDAYTIDFNTMGGNTITSMTIEEGESIKELPTPIKEGHKFLYWYLEDEGVPFRNEDYTINENITLYAKWEAKSFTITFDDENVDEENKNVTYTYATSMDDLTPTGKAEFKPKNKAGYAFKYWYEEGNDKEFDFTKPLDKNVTLKAKWELIDVTVKFKNEDKTDNTSKVVKYNQKVEGIENPSKKNYTFVGWFKCLDDTCDTTDNNEFVLANTPITEDITLIAKFKPNTYTLKFDDQNVQENKRLLSFTAPNLVPKTSKPDIENEYKLQDKDGYTFKYWYDSEVGENQPFDFNAELTKNTILYAKWEGKKLVVTFINDNEQKEEQVEYDHHVNKPTDPSKVGYVFDGWYKCTNDNCTTTESTKFDFNSYITKDTKLKAKWNALSYTITFDDTNVDEENKIVTYTYKDSMEDLKPINKESFTPTNREGYIFEYWYEDGNPNTRFDFTKVLTKNVTLKAKWKAVSYTITFDDDNVDSSDRTKTYTYENSMDNLKPTDKAGFKPKDKTGYTFEYWYEDGDENTQFDFNEALTKDVKLKAKWKINTYTVTFEESEISSQTIEYNNKATKPQPDPVKEGYDFVGWYKCTNDDCSETEEEEFDFESTPIVGDIKIKAVWETKRITVTFKNYDNSIHTTKRVDYNTDLTIDDINNPERTSDVEYNGYRFLGWYKCDDETCEEKDSQVFNVDTNGKGLKEDLTLIAKYELIVYTNRIASDFVENMNFEDFSTILGGDTKIYFNILKKDTLLSKNFDEFVESIESIINVENVKNITIDYNGKNKNLNFESNVSDEFKEIFNSLTGKDFDNATTLDLDDKSFTLKINLKDDIKNSADQNTDTYEVVFDSNNFQIVRDEQGFKDALDDKKEVILAQDITITNVINIANDVAIDGRNYKLISNVNSKYLFNITSGSVVLKDIELKIDTLKPSEYSKETHKATKEKNTIAVYVGNGAKLTVTNVKVTSDVTINDLKMDGEELSAHKVSVNQNAAVELHGELYGNGLTYQNEYYGSPTVMMGSDCNMKIDGLHKVMAVYDIKRDKGADGQNRNEEFIHLYKNSDHTELKYVLYSFDRRFLPIAYLHGEKFIIPEAFNEGGDYYNYIDAGETYEFNGKWSYYDSGRKDITSEQLKEMVVTDTNISLLNAQYSKKES